MNRAAVSPLPDPYPVLRAERPLLGEVCVPGSKSLTNRALLLAALAAGPTHLANALRSDDTDRLARALQTLGVPVALEEESIAVQGVAGRFPCAQSAKVDLGDGGTPARFMLAAAALASAPVIIDGSARLRERPFADGIELLRALGVRVVELGAPGRLPVRVEPTAAPLAGGELDVGQTASSQFISALLLIAPWLRHGLTLRLRHPPTSAAYIDLTIDELRRWGVAVHEERDAAGTLQMVRVAAGAPAPRARVAVEADASSALYWAAAAAIVPGSQLQLRGLPGDSRQPDMAAIHMLASMGARVESLPDAVRLSFQADAPLHGIRCDASGFPDGALALAAVAAVARGPTRITGLATLRVKESDRLAAMQAELARIGCAARADTAALTIDPPPILAPARVCIQTYRDHRVAMSFAILGLRIGGLRIADPGCVHKSYPHFWADLERLRTGG